MAKKPEAHKTVTLPLADIERLKNIAQSVENSGRVGALSSFSKRDYEFSNSKEKAEQLKNLRIKEVRETLGRFIAKHADIRITAGDGIDPANEEIRAELVVVSLKNWLELSNILFKLIKD